MKDILKRNRSTSIPKTPDLELGTYRQRRFRGLPASHDGPPYGLLGLPPELHYLIIKYLDFDSLLALRRASRLHQDLITVNLIRRMFIHHGRIALALTACCNTCLCTPGLDRLIVDNSSDNNLWQSICFRCWSEHLTRDYHINPWPVVQLVNGEEGYICHFCNWPVLSDDSPGRDKKGLHAGCRVRRRAVLAIWFSMAFLQFGLGVLCAVLGWTRYRHKKGILIPATVDFALSMASVAVFVYRIYTSNERRYRKALFIEFLLTIVRLPPVAYSAHTTVVVRLQAGLLPRFGFGVFLINLFCWPRIIKWRL
ncbi:hypothetical protein F5Y16DRAFT_270865 [Xylariaceae sp. FL0255]|nr:hypothetical protein F5Y16DRAFT_270865 [Xylariaceae sp. FL0255]